MAEMRKRTSMSVPEMGRMLGLGKTESYWLIKKNYFKTILVGNTMRVMIDSFEEWYANQFKYQKVDGTPPGEELKKKEVFICVIQPVIKALFGNADMTADSDAVEYTLFYQIICCGTTDKIGRASCRERV